jgi:hypothetical protein|nr:MAG TPA: hypothetical protein [Bacteriophage sp.]DAW42456.1 MAG TPA: hypothetical protein [Bacteriophage sp.]
MIRLEHTVLPSPEQMEFVIEGMRNPMNSWDKSDSGYQCVCCSNEICKAECTGDDLCPRNGKYRLGDKDHSLMFKLAKFGTDHRKYLRMMPVYVRITAPLYWWKEFDTYKVGTVANSCSTMHKITEKEFNRSDFSHEHIFKSPNVYSGAWDMETSNMFFSVNIQDGIYFSSEDILDFTIQALNYYRKKYIETKDKKYWWQLIQLLPSSYNQTRNSMLNYEVLANIYKSRQNHKLDEWRDFCDWIETLPYSDLITGKETK